MHSKCFETVQQQTGRTENAANFDTYGIGVYQHTFPANARHGVRGTVRQFTGNFNSNPESTPVE